MTIKFTPVAMLALALVAGCGEKDTRLPGVREAVLSSGVTRAKNSAAPLRLPAQRANASWTHRLGEADHTITHPALARVPGELFSVSIGAAETRRSRITAEPIVAAGRIFTMDAQATVQATATSGKVLWRRALVPPFDSAIDGAGGGLAYGAGKVFATSGFGELTAINPATGAVLWTQDLDAPGGSAPAVSGDLVYVVARDGTAWAIDVESGRIRWTLPGATSNESVGAGAGPAIAGGTVVLPFPNGQVVGALPQTGVARWTTYVAGTRPGFAASAISDVTADPVIDGSRVYVGNGAGRLAALHRENGEEIWSIPMAAKYPVWPAGGSLFLVNDLNQLVRLNAATGQVIWQQPLPQFAKERWARASNFYAHYGPILAGGRLIVASSDGAMRQYDPRNGRLLSQAVLTAGATGAPAVAGRTLYAVTKDGMLHAFR